MEKEDKKSTPLDRIEKVTIAISLTLGIGLIFSGIAIGQPCLLGILGLCFTVLALAMCHDYNKYK
jgi:hypothetical protein